MRWAFLFKSIASGGLAFSSYMVYEVRHYRQVQHLQLPYLTTTTTTSGSIRETSLSVSRETQKNNNNTDDTPTVDRRSGSVMKWISRLDKKREGLADTYIVSFPLTLSELDRLMSFVQRSTTTHGDDSSSSLSDASSPPLPPLNPLLTEVALRSVVNSLLFRCELLVGAAFVFGGLRETWRQSSTAYLGSKLFSVPTRTTSETEEGSLSFASSSFQSATAESVGAWSYSYLLTPLSSHSSSSTTSQQLPNKTITTRDRIEEGQLMFLPLIESGNGFEGLAISAHLTLPPSTSSTDTIVQKDTTSVPNTTTTAAQVELRMSYVMHPFDQLDKGGVGESIALTVHDWFCKMMLAQTVSAFHRILAS